MQMIWLQSKIYVHEKNTSGDPCMCCDSKESAVSQILPDLDLLIDPINKTRQLRHEADDKEEWDRLAAMAKKIDLIFRCTPQGLEVINEKASIVGIGGSARAGKTQIALVWFARMWMLRGGNNARLWLVGPQLDHCHTLLNKLILGDYEDQRWAPPVLPTDKDMNPILAHTWPLTLRATDQTCYMIDGSKIELRHSKPSRIRGVSIQACVYTECSDVPSVETFAHLRARIVTTRGRVLVESTFKDTQHWFQTQVKQFGIAEQEKKDRESDHKKRCSYYHYIAPNNPWNSEEAIQEWKESIKDEVMLKREFYGEAADEQNRMWADVWNEITKIHLLYEDESWNLEHLGLKDVTRKISRRLFKKPVDFIVGMDFNVFPFSSVVCQVGCTDENDESTYILIVRDVVQTNGGTIYDHLKKVSERYQGVYKNKYGVVCDVNAKWDNDPSHVGRSSSTVMNIIERHGIQAKAPAKDRKGKVCNPPIRMSCTVLKRMMRQKRMKIHSVDADKLIFAFENQNDDGSGKPLGKGRGKTGLNDRMNSPVDSVRYVAWSLFKHEDLPRTPTVIHRLK